MVHKCHLLIKIFSANVSIFLGHYRFHLTGNLAKSGLLLRQSGRQWSEVLVEDMMNSVVEKGLQIQNGPFQPNPQTKFFFVLDPNGLKIQFVQLN